MPKASHDERARGGGYTRWNKKYDNKFPHIVASNKGPEFYRCLICDHDGKLAKSGRRFIEEHIRTKKHQDALQGNNKSKPLAEFTTEAEVHPNLEEKAIAAELSFAFHGAKHNHSLRSTDCTSKLISTVSSDPSAKRFAPARTKCTAFIKKVIHPHLKSLMITEIEQQAGGYFSIGLDVSYFREIKLHALVIRYMTSFGLKNRVLELIELPSGTAEDMVNSILTNLERNGLDRQKLIGLTMDNTSANFGDFRDNTVFAILKRDVNEKLLGVGCASHIAHNAAQFAGDKMDYEFQAFLGAVDHHFSGCAQRWDHLKQYTEQHNVPLKRLPDQGCNRWLSLGRLVSAVLEMWPALVSYFKSTDVVCDITLRDVFDETSGEKIYECRTVLSFLSFILGHFNKFTCLITQEMSLSMPRLADEVAKFISLLKGFQEHQFFGTATNDLLERLEQWGLMETRRKLEGFFMKFYEDALDYLNNWFHFVNEFASFGWLQLNKDSLEFREVAQSYKHFISEDATERDKLFTEVIEVNDNLKKLHGTGFDKLDIANKWLILFKSDNIVHLRIVVFALLSIFASNSFCESVFSLVKTVWSDEKARLGVDTLNALISVKLNSDFDCNTFYEHVLCNQQLLNKAKADAKYERSVK